MACWELCVKHSLPWVSTDCVASAADVRKCGFISGMVSPNFSCFQNEYTELRNAVKSKKNDFTCSIQKHSIGEMKKQGVYTLCDEIAVAVAFDQEVAVEKTGHFVTVQLDGRHTRGQMIVDNENKLGKQANVDIIKTINLEVLLHYLIQAVQ